MKTKYKILPFKRDIRINEEILVHFFNYVMYRRVGPLYSAMTDPDNSSIFGGIKHNELQNWKVQLIEDLLRGTINFKDKDDE